MKLLFQRPTPDYITRTIEAYRAAPLTYESVGATREAECPDGFWPNHTFQSLGRGRAVYEAGKNAIRSLEMMELGWFHPVAPEPISDGSIVCTLARWSFLYTLNVARVIHVDDESPDRFGFSYGTTAAYPLIGEERFTVSIDHATDEVSFEIFSFSKPKSLLMKLGLPAIRQSQRRFCRDVNRRMVHLCRNAG